MIKLIKPSAVLFLLSFSLLMVFAQVPEGGTMLNAETGTTYAKNGNCTATTVTITDQDFTKAIRVVVGTDVANTWDAQLSFPAVGGVAKDDVVLVAFYARTISSLDETGEGTLNVIMEKKVSYEKQLTANIKIGGEWKEYYARAKMTTTWAQSELSLLFHMGFPSQTVEVADVRFLNYQNSLNLEDLPETEITYSGQAPDAAWRAPAEERINQIRKGGANITVYDENGAPLEGAQIHVEMENHRFGFGTAIAASEFNDNATYRNKVMEDFNEVVFENDLKWPQFNAEASNDHLIQAMDSLDAHQIPIRGHNVIWPSYRFCPSFLQNLDNNPVALRNAIDQRIDDVTRFTNGRLNDWDVMNEPYSEHDLQDVLGDEVMADWFKRVRRNDRDVKLYIN
ncbi:MAG: endo-1,4-beta-xylanase, partial [Bacteroides sp.]|nr:endo-1,4-beta-xylanase [Bacteroides sp.]